MSNLVFKTNPLVSILFTLASNVSYAVLLTTSFFTASICLLKSAGTGTNLPISYLATSAFKLTKSDFGASLDVSIPVAFLNQFLLHN